MQLSFLALSQGKKTRSGTFLETMDKVVPWALLLRVIGEHYPDLGVGRPKTDLELLLRAFCLAQWFNLSDAELEDAIHDRVSFQRFLRLDAFGRKVPDHTVFCRFRNFLHEKALSERLFAEVNGCLQSQGLLMREGRLVDATLISAPGSTKNAGKARDPEMKSTKKGNQWYFGMKAHVGVDVDSGLVHSLRFTSANIPDVNEMENLLHGEERLVCGDKGYASGAFRVRCAELGVEYAILEKKAAGESPAERVNREERNRLKSWIRAKVEHPFRVVKHLWGHWRTRYRGVDKNGSWLRWSFLLANLYLLRKKLLKQERSWGTCA